MARFVLVGEDQCHWHTVSCWTDVLLRDAVDWLREHDALDAFREWAVDDEARLEQQPYLKASRTSGEFGARRWLSHGQFAKYSGPDAKASVDRLLRAQAIHPAVDAVFLCRDTDNQPERRNAARLARDQGPPAERDWPFKVVLAIASPEMEAWRIALFTPRSAAEHARLEAVSKRLDFNPVVEPTRLSTSPRSKAESKAVLSELGVGDTWREVDAASLKAVRGPDLGLADFVADVLRFLVPLFDRTPKR